MRVWEVGILDVDEGEEEEDGVEEAVGGEVEALAPDEPLELPLPLPFVDLGEVGKTGGATNEGTYNCVLIGYGENGTPGGRVSWSISCGRA